MLEELHVSGLALIDDVWLEFASGFTVLTGETGAGKTVLVGALKLLLGERADASLVRSGADQALVEGRFVAGGHERTARRRVSAEGRSKCYLDGAMATVGDLAETLGPLVDLHGQHEHQALLAPSRHATYLDRFAGAKAARALADWQAAFDEATAATGARDELRDALAGRDQELDYLAFQVIEIDAVAPVAGEDDEIAARLPRLRHGERLAQAAAAAYAALREEGGAADAGAAAAEALHGVHDVDPALDELAGELGETLTSLDDIGSRLRDYGDSVEYDPAALNEAEARMAALATLKKKYGPTLDDVLAQRDAAVERRELLSQGEQGLAAAEERVTEATSALRATGEALAGVREAAAPLFSRELAAASADLALQGAAFEVELDALPEDRWTRQGPQRVEFLFSPAEGEPARPLARIASGGEVSRVMLALKSVLGEADDVDVLVFDEVDAGIGGRTAVAVGERLARLARTHQVLVITHLAQVAAFADAHMTVEKAQRDGRTVTTVRPVTGDQRIAEVARMLSGTDSEAGLAHARELLAQASEAVEA